MNAARIGKSSRLKRVARFLKDGKPHTTMEIVQCAAVCAVNSIIAELRENGFKIHCWRIGDNWYYQLISGKHLIPKG